MANIAINARITKDAPFTVPPGKVAEFHAFGVSTLHIDAVEIFNAAVAAQLGRPIVAPAGSVISTPHAQCGVSGYLMDAT